MICTKNDLDVYSLIYEQELSAFMKDFESFVAVKVSTIQEEYTLIYPFSNGNITSFFDSKIPFHERRFNSICDLFHQYIYVDDEISSPLPITFLEYISLCWEHVSKETLNNIPNCLDNYELNSRQKSLFSRTQSLLEHHAFSERTRDLSKNLFVEILLRLSLLGLTGIIEKGYLGYHKRVLSISAILKFRTLSSPVRNLIIQTLNDKSRTVIIKSSYQKTKILKSEDNESVVSYLYKCVRAFKSITQTSIDATVLLCKPIHIHRSSQRNKRSYEIDIYKHSFSGLIHVGRRLELRGYIRGDTSPLPSIIYQKY